MKARLQVRYFASNTDMTSPDQARKDNRPAWYGTCPVWAQDCRKAGMAVAQETVLAYGQREACACCGGSHMVVPPPWTVV
jgi:hypothetical protein